jgi:hypothetical protein
LFDAYRYVAGCCVYGPGISWAVLLSLTSSVGKLYSAVSIMRTRIYSKIFFLSTSGCGGQVFFLWTSKKRVAWTKDREREADLAQKLCCLTDNRFYESRIFVTLTNDFISVIIRYFTEVRKLFLLTVLLCSLFIILMNKYFLYLFLHYVMYKSECRHYSLFNCVPQSMFFRSFVASYFYPHNGRKGLFHCSIDFFFFNFLI